LRRSKSASAPSGPAPIPGVAVPLRSALAPRPLVRWRTRLASLVVATGVAIFGLLGWLVDSGQAATTDLALTLELQQTHNPLLVALMTLVSAFGFPPQSVLMVLAAITFFW